VAPASRLSVLVGIGGERTQRCRGADVAGELTGELNILGDDVECAAGGEGAGEHATGDAVEGAALTGADRHNLGQDVEVDTGLGRDEHPFDRGDEVGVAQVLGHQLGSRTGAARADMEDISGDSLEQGLVRLLTSDPEACKKVLQSSGFYVIDGEVLVLDLFDRLGKLAEITAALAEAKLNVDYVYGSVEHPGAPIRLVLKASDGTRAHALLSELADV